jgi:hypothetical protein
MAYHPQTDGSSERSNKTINQSIHYHVRCNQKGWVRALPRIQFTIMNTVNASVNYTPFQLQMGCSHCIIPPIVPTSLAELHDIIAPADLAQNIALHLETDVMDAKDNLLNAKITQAHYANEQCGLEDTYAIGDKVMLSTLHRQQEYKSKGQDHVAKFFPRYDGPYDVIDAHPSSSTYTLMYSVAI